jgi:hypothetical protein
VADINRNARPTSSESAPLAIGLAGDSYVVIAKIAESNLIGITAAMAALLLLIGLWYGFPLAMLAARQRTSRCPERSARA